MNRKVLNVFFTISLVLTLFSSHAMTAGCGSANESAKKPHIATKLFDVLIVRPVSVGAAAVSTGICIATLPFTFPVGVSEESASVLVEAPWRFAGGRCLGEWNHYKDGQPITALPEDCDAYGDNKMLVSSAKAKMEDRREKDNHEVVVYYTPEFVTLDGYDAKNGIISELFLWRELNNPLAGVKAIARHGEQAKCIKQDDAWIFVETVTGKRGWLKKEFAKEFRKKTPSSKTL